MSIAVIIPENWEPAKLVLWSTTLARAKHEDLLIIRTKRLRAPRRRRKTQQDAAADDSPLMAAIREHASDFLVVNHDVPCTQKGARAKARNTEQGQPRILLKELNETELVEGVLGEIKALRVALLIVPRRQGVQISEEEFASQRRLFQEAPCEVLQLRPGKRSSITCESILVATNGKKLTSTALNVGVAFAASEEKKLTALYVEEDAGSSSRANPQRSVERLVRKSLKANAEHVIPRVVIDADIPNGVRAYAAAKGHDTVIVGVGRDFTEDRRLRDSVSEKLMVEMGDSTIVVVRKAMPLAGRLLKLIEHRKKSLVPQLDRQSRVEVAQRLQSTAGWDFDYLILIFLATLLAALGLLMNSSPVVIGAMLVAPLMTPMLGLGLSVVQGNRLMANRCLGTIGRGFLVAFATGCIVGILLTLFTSGTTQEMSIRGAPSALDLAVAFVSGMVAAYAFGRPHLLSVLPGIAIASSLVPPLATAGLSLIALDLNLTLGAILLFLSNFVAIVLGSAFALWVVGMRGPREICPFTAWARRYMFGFCAIAACLAVLFAFRGDASQLQASLAIEEASSPPGDAAEQTQLASDERKIRVVFKPVPEEGRKKQSPSVTVVIPNKPPGDAAEQSQLASDEREIRVVFQPVTEEDGKKQSPSVTVVIPNKPPGEEQDTTIEIEGLPEPARGGPLSKWLNDRRAMFPFSRRTDKNESAPDEQPPADAEPPK